MFMGMIKVSSRMERTHIYVSEGCRVMERGMG